MSEAIVCIGAFIRVSWSLKGLPAHVFPEPTANISITFSFFFFFPYRLSRPWRILRAGACNQTNGRIVCTCTCYEFLAEAKWIATMILCNENNRYTHKCLFGEGRVSLINSRSQPSALSQFNTVSQLDASTYIHTRRELIEEFSFRLFPFPPSCNSSLTPKFQVQLCLESRDNYCVPRSCSPPLNVHLSHLLCAYLFN